VAGCATFRTSEFTIEDDAAWQVECTQVFPSELFFVDRNHSFVGGGRDIKAPIEKMLQHQEITFA
jgi:hypothetical protein